MSVVVTGASGLIGQNVLRCLAAEGRPVRAVDCDLVGLDGLDVEPVCADVRDLAALVRAFDGAETVYHLAARISIRRRDAALTHAVNVEGTRNVVVACERCGVRRLVHFSSIHALSASPLAEPIDETRALAAGRGSLAYDRSKAKADTVVLAAAARGLDAVIVTPTAAIGPHDLRPSHMGAAILQMARGTLPGAGSTGSMRATWRAAPSPPRCEGDRASATSSRAAGARSATSRPSSRQPAGRRRRDSISRPGSPASPSPCSPPGAACAVVPRPTRGRR